MNINIFKKIIKEIKSEFMQNKKIFEDAIKKELEIGYIINFEELVKEFEDAEKDIVDSGIMENEKLAVIYKGFPEVTIKMIINSIFFNYTTYFCIEGYEIINTIIVELVNNILKEFKINTDLVIVQKIEDIIENQNSFKRIVYIGDYFEYKNEQIYFNKELIYNSYGFLKVYIDKNKYKDEYKELIKFSYKKNISIEYYEDIKDFIENVEEYDSVIIYELSENIDEILKKIKPKKVYTHDEFLNEYSISLI